VAFLLRDILAFLFRNTIYFWHLFVGAFLLIMSRSEGFLHMLAFLTRLIPALLVP